MNTFKIQLYLDMLCEKDLLKTQNIWLDSYDLTFNLSKGLKACINYGTFSISTSFRFSGITTFKDNTDYFSSEPSVPTILRSMVTAEIAVDRGSEYVVNFINEFLTCKLADKLPYYSVQYRLEELKNEHPKSLWIRRLLPERTLVTESFVRKLVGVAEDSTVINTAAL